MNKDKSIEQLITDYSQYTTTNSGTVSKNHLDDFQDHSFYGNQVIGIYEANKLQDFNAELGNGFQATPSVAYLSQSNITGTITADETLKWDSKALIRITFREKSLNKFFENTEAIAKIRMAEFLRYSHEQFLVY